MPEVSRNRNIGEVGANMNAATFRTFLNGMAWAQEPVTIFGDLSYLQKEAYEAAQAQAMAAAELWQGSFGESHFVPGQVCLHAQHHMLMDHDSNLAITDSALLLKDRIIASAQKRSHQAASIDHAPNCANAACGRLVQQKAGSAPVTLLLTCLQTQV